MIARTLTALLLLIATPAWAELVKIEVKSRADVLAGQAFGSAGPYEKLAGILHFAVDPRNAANRIITDLDKAPKNARGLVEFSSDFYLIKPKDPSRGNGTLLYEVRLGPYADQGEAERAAAAVRDSFRFAPTLYQEEAGE